MIFSCQDKKPVQRIPLLAGILMASLLLSGCKEQTKPAQPKTMPVVTAVTVTPQRIPMTSRFIAQVEGSHQVEIVARVSGFLEKIVYLEGSRVESGDVLFQLDRKPFQAQLDASLAEVESRRAQLWTAKANLDRIQPLAAQNAASKSDLDNATGNFRAAEAALNEAIARKTKAELELGYTTITSPISGLTGQALVREGAYLQAAGAGANLTYVVNFDPVWITFSISQNDYARMLAEVAKGLVEQPKNHDYFVELEMPDGTRYASKGRFNFADPSYSKDTATFLVRASFPNPKGVLRPGMFVTALVQGATRPNAMVIPQKAVQQTAKGHVVYTLDEKDQVGIRPVLVGDWLGENWIINQGLKAGDRVVVAGFQRLAPGMQVKVGQQGAEAAAEKGHPAPPAAK